MNRKVGRAVLCAPKVATTFSYSAKEGAQLRSVAAYRTNGWGKTKGSAPGARGYFAEGIVAAPDLKAI